MSFLSRVRAPGRSAIASAIVAMLVLAASWVGLTYSTAQAAINENIKVSDLSLIPSNGNGVEDPTYNKTKVNDILKLKFTWDATTADPKSGQSFQIGLPSQFSNRENLTEPMTVTHNGADHKIGECVMDAQNITCTFNDTLDTLRGQGFNGLSGKGSALVVASEATEESTASINANGQVTAVPIPGGRITENRGLNYTPETLRKWAYDVTAASKQMDWEITFGPSQLKDALAAAGTPITLDGQTRSTITFTDELSPGQAYLQDLTKWRLNIGSSSTRDDVYGQVTDAAGNDQDTSQGDFDFNVAIDGNRATLTVTGPFAADTNYNIYYSSTPTSDSGTVQPGLEYKNHAQLKGTDQDSSWSVYYTRSFTIDVELAPGFGGFHRIEYALWHQKDTKSVAKYADQLQADVEELHKRLTDLTFPPEKVVGGAAVLMEEVAATKISGEEDRYSHTDLWDFQANFEGAYKIVELLKPLIAREDKAFLDKTEKNFETVFNTLKKYRTKDGGFVTYDKLTEGDRKILSARVNTLAEDLSKLRGMFGLN